MSNGKHISAKTVRSSGRKSRTLLVAILLLVVFAVGGTLAYLISVTGDVVNTFTPSKVTCEVDETVEDGIKTSIMIENTGDTDAYIRVAVIANQLTDGKITGPADVSKSLDGEGWVKNGDYWYWTEVVEVGDKTGELLAEGKTIDFNEIQVTILAEAIQSEGVNSNGTKAVVDAWGVDPSALGSN